MALVGSAMKQILKTGAVYFGIVFAVGFVLGMIRTLWVVPFVASGQRNSPKHPPWWSRLFSLPSGCLADSGAR